MEFLSGISLYTWYGYNYELVKLKNHVIFVKLYNFDNLNRFYLAGDKLYIYLQTALLFCSDRIHIFQPPNQEDMLIL